MHIQLSDHFFCVKLLRFTFPSMVMMVFTSIYGVVDGVFVSNFVGTDAFAAVNLIMPFLMLLGALGFMVGSGSSALVSFTLGSGQTERAMRIFSLLIYILMAVGAVLTAAGIVLMEPVARLLGADETLLPLCVRYGQLVLIALIPFMLQNAFQSFLVTAERPQLGLYLTIAAGLTNMALDALLIAWFRWGVTGAALATALSQLVGGVLPLLYFALPIAACSVSAAPRRTSALWSRPAPTACRSFCNWCYFCELDFMLRLRHSKQPFLPLIIGLAADAMLFAPCQYALPAVSAFCDSFGSYRQSVLLI